MQRSPFSTSASFNSATVVDMIQNCLIAGLIQRLQSRARIHHEPRRCQLFTLSVVHDANRTRSRSALKKGSIWMRAPDVAGKEGTSKIAQFLKLSVYVRHGDSHLLHWRELYRAKLYHKQAEEEPVQTRIRRQSNRKDCEFICYL